MHELQSCLLRQLRHIRNGAVIPCAQQNVELASCLLTHRISTGNISCLLGALVNTGTLSRTIYPEALMRD